LLSPSKGKHPYLLWTALLAGVGPGAASYFLSQYEVSQDKKTQRIPSSPPSGVVGLSGLESRTPSDGRSDDGVMVGESDEELERAEQDVNGEEVRTAVEKTRLREAWRAGVTGAAFAMAVVGLWGDGF